MRPNCLKIERIDMIAALPDKIRHTTIYSVSSFILIFVVAHFALSHKAFHMDSFTRN